MPFGINVVSVRQKKLSQFRKDLKIEIFNEKEDGVMGARYGEIWPFMCQTEGIWYTLGIDDGIYSAVPLCGSDFDCPEEERPIPHWISDEDFSYQLTPLFLKEPYIEEIQEILCQLIEESPKKTILFQTRYQCPDKEIIEGVLPFEVFWKLLLEQKLLFNTCYIVHKGDTGMPDIDEEEDE